jgi:predicted NBD/HSP70 family sugar kinase
MYAGIDLHSTNLFVTLLDETGKVMEEKQLTNDADKLFSLLLPYREGVETVAIESTYN